MICVLYISVTLSIGHRGSEDCDKMATILTTNVHTQERHFYIFICCIDHSFNFGMAE